MNRNLWAAVLLCFSVQAICSAFEMADEHDGIFHIAVGNRLERYDLAGKDWLSPLIFVEALKAVHVDESGIYASFGRSVAKFDLSGSNETRVANTPADVTAIHTLGNHLYLVYPSYPFGNLQSLSKTSLATIDHVKPVYDLFVGSSLSPQAWKIFGRDWGTSPGDISSIVLNDDGTFGAIAESPYHGTFPGADRTFVFPDGARVADNSGTVYNTADLTYSGSFAGPVEDVTFYGGEAPVALRSGVLLGFTPALLPTGRTEIGLPGASRVIPHGEDLIVFAPSAGANGVAVKIVHVSSLTPEAPEEPLDPSGVAYIPDSVFLDSQQVLHLFTPSLKSIFRWDTRARSYTNTLPLVGTPSHAAYSADNDTIYLAHASGLIDRYSLGAEQKQVPFVNSPQRPIGLATAGEFVFVCDQASPWVTHYIYSPAGTLLSSKDWNYFSQEYIWNAATRRMFFFRDDTSPNDLLTEEITGDGKLGASSETPYHGDYPIVHPIRVNDAGTKVVLGSGDIYTGESLAREGSLGNGIGDAVWFGNDIVSIRDIGGVAQLQHWSAPNYAATATRQLNGPFLGLKRLPDSVLAITREFGAPRFHILSLDLEVIYSSPVPPLAPSDLIATDVTAESVVLTWRDNADNEDGFVISVLDSSSTEWRNLATVGPDTTSFLVTDLSISSFYDFRVIGFNKVASTDPAGPVTVKTLPDPRSPLGPPFEFQSTRILAHEVRLEWRDNATNELGFRLERSTNAVWAALTNLPPGTTAYVDSGLTPNTLYTYRLRAFNDFSDSEVSPDLQIRTLLSNALPPVGSPSSLRTVSLAPQSVTLAWNEGIPNEDAFVIERGTNQFMGTLETIGHAAANATTFTDTTVQPSSRYFYRVYATNQFGRSSSTQTIPAHTPSLGGIYLGFSGRNSNVVYFAFEGPLRLERFDLETATWLSSLSLGEKPNAMLVAADGLYFGFGRKITRFDHEMENEQFLGNIEGDVRVLFDWNNYIYASAGRNRYVSIDRTSGNFVWQGESGWYSIYPGLAVAPSGKVLARSSGVSPSDILSIELKSDGSMGLSKDSPYHGDFPGGNAVFMFPNGSKVLDSAGILYNVSDLTYAGSVAGQVTDVAFHGADIPIIARGSDVIALSNLLLETGRTSLDREPLRIFAQGDHVFAFVAAGNVSRGIEAAVIPLGDLNPAEPGQAPVFHGAPFTPEDVFVDKNGVLHLFSKQFQAIFRWSGIQREELPTIPLLGGPAYVAYSAPNHTIYLAYAEGQITQIKLNESHTETGFVNLPATALGLETAGEIVFAVDASGAWVTHSTYAPDGQRLSSRDWNYFSRDYTWSPANRRMYHFRDDTSPNDLLAERIGADGTITGSTDSPYHGEVGTIHPIRVSPDARSVVLGSGQIYDGDTLVRTNSLANGITDAAWRGTVLYSVREIAGGIQVQRWSATYAQTAIVEFEGKPLRLLNSSEGLLLVTIEQEQPRIRILSDNLATVYEKPINHAPTSITLMPNTVIENGAAGTVVGLISVSDPNAADTHRVELSSGRSTAFEVKTNTLILKQPLDFEAARAVTLSVRAIDSYGRAFTESVVVNVLDANEGPTDILLSRSAVSENLAVGSLVASVDVLDPDVGDAPAVQLLDDAGGRFALEGRQLTLARPLAYAEAASHQIRIRTVDSGGLILEKSMSIAVQEYVPPPPTGALTIAFESSGASGLQVANWNEAGFSVSSVSNFDVGETTNEVDAFNGTSTLRISSSNEVVIRHRSNLPFRVVSLELAELTPKQTERSAILRAEKPGSPDITSFVALDAVGDGSGPLRDFQTIYPGNQFSGLTSLAILNAGEGVVIDNIVVIVGEVNRTFVWIRPTRAHAWESELDQPGASYPNTAQWSVERHGPMNQPLQCRLTFAGNAGYFSDYFVAGLPLDHLVNFAPGQGSVPLELIPLQDSLAEPAEVVDVSFQPSPGFTAVSSGAFYIHNTAMEAWFANENPQADGDYSAALDLLADPDGNGLSHMSEFVMGVKAADREAAQPMFRFTRTASGMAVDCMLTRSALAIGWKYLFEETTDFKTWRQVTPQSAVDLSNPPLQQMHYVFELPQGTGSFIRLSIVPES